MSIVSSVADAITRQEGRTQNNNPGNIWDGLDPAHGKTKRIWPELPIDSRGFVIYPTIEAGRAAMEHDLSLKIARGMTLEQVLSAWAPASDPRNNTPVYIANVSAWTGLPTGVPLNTLSAISNSDISITAPDPSGLDHSAFWDDPTMVGDDGVSEVGSANWGLVAGLGLALLAIWWMSSD